GSMACPLPASQRRPRPRSARFRLLLLYQSGRVRFELSVDGRFSLPLLERANLDIAEPNGGAVILKQDVAFADFAESLRGFELALGDVLLQVLAAALELDHLDAIQPVLDMIAFDDDSCLVEFADGIELLGFACRDQVVKRSGGAIARDPRFGVGMIYVIQNLIFKTDGGSAGRRHVFGNQVLDAAVAALRQFPFDREFKVVELIDGDQVAARSAPFAFGRHFFDAAVFDRPAFWRLVAVKPAPAVKRFAIKQQSPPGGFFGLG